MRQKNGDDAAPKACCRLQTGREATERRDLRVQSLFQSVIGRRRPKVSVKFRQAVPRRGRYAMRTFWASGPMRGNKSCDLAGPHLAMSFPSNIRNVANLHIEQTPNSQGTSRPQTSAREPFRELPVSFSTCILVSLIVAHGIWCRTAALQLLERLTPNCAFSSISVGGASTTVQATCDRRGRHPS